MLAGAVSGDAMPEQWGVPGRAADFFDIKGDVEALLALTRAEFHFRPVTHPALHPGQSAEIVGGGPGGVERVGLVEAIERVRAFTAVSLDKSPARR